MKIAFAGKGGTGKTTLSAWTADYLARQGHNVWLIDADTALSLGTACGLQETQVPVPLAEREDLIEERIGKGLISLTPEVKDLPELLSIRINDPGKNGCFGEIRLLVMGSIASAGSGCACEANALLKSLLAHLVMDRKEYVLVDLEAGVEHLGRGTVQHVDGLIIVSEPSMRSLQVAARICVLGQGLGLANQVLVLNKAAGLEIPERITPLPDARVAMPYHQGLGDRMLESGSVMGLPGQENIDAAIYAMLSALQGAEGGDQIS